jgi:hypothetical protein
LLSLTLASTQLLLFSCNAAPTPAALLAQLQPGVLSALASFFSHSSAPVCAFAAASCLLIVKRCAAEGAQLLHNTGLSGEIEDAVERWRSCRRDARQAPSTVACDKVIALLENSLQNILVLCDSSSSSAQTAALIVKQLRAPGQRVDVAQLSALLAGPAAMSALQLLKSGLPLALAQFLCAENDYSRPSLQCQLDRLIWFFGQLSSSHGALDTVPDGSNHAVRISSETCFAFLSEVVSLLIDGISSKEQVQARAFCSIGACYIHSTIDLISAPA